MAEDIEKRRASNRAFGARRYALGRAWIDAIKIERGCIDCGYNAHPAALDFDHREDTIKLFGIASALTRKRETVEAEIAKCDVRCANCHRIKTAERPSRGGRPRAAVVEIAS